MSDSVECIKCGEDFPLRRYNLGYETCLKCGEVEARKRKFTSAPMHKSNYVLITKPQDLIGLNNKGGLVTSRDYSND